MYISKRINTKHYISKNQYKALLCKMDGRFHLNIDLYNIYFILKLRCAWNLDLDLHCNNLSVKMEHIRI